MHMIPHRVRRSGREMFYHVLIIEKLPKRPEIHVVNMKWDYLAERVLEPYRQGKWITLHGQYMKATDIDRIRIIRTGYALRKNAPFTHEPGYVYSRGEQNVTDALITGPPGYAAENNRDRRVNVKTLTDAFELMITIEEIRSASRQLFLDGHYQNAVEDAYKAVEHAVAEKCDISDYGASLMRKAFDSEPPLIALTKLETESQKRVQEGYGHLFAGSMMAIRNPRAHGSTIDEPGEALELILLAQHLMRKLHGANKLATGGAETPT